jgi:glycogen operon protein
MLFLSQGVPMLLGGDEFGRSQEGNNNTYCQDNELTWYSWERDAQQRDLTEFTRALIDFRTRHPVFRRRRFFTGVDAEGVRDIAWFAPDGIEMTPERWADGWLRSLGFFLNGQAIPTPDIRGRRIRDESFLVLLQARDEDETFTLPSARWGRQWGLVFDTATAPPLDRDGRFDELPQARTLAAGEPLTLTSRSVVLLRRLDDDPGD